MHNYTKRLFLYQVLLLLAGNIYAQGPGSTEAHNSTEYTSSGTTISVVAESFYLGPNTDWTIDGTLEVYSKNVWIAPGALLQGTGTIRFYNPSDAGGTASATLIDGNDNTSFIDINIELLNAAGMILTDLTDPGYGADNPGNATLTIGKDLNFGIDNGHITLNGSDLVLDNDASFTNFGTNRMIITSNSLAGHVVKENYNSTFTFPIGIAAGNYSPATIAPTFGTVTTHASVQDYASTAVQIDVPAEGMGLVWHIYADAPATVALTLEHSTSGGAAYNDMTAFITQYQGSGQWSSSIIPHYNTTGVHTSTSFLLAGSSADNGAWMTKSSDMNSPLPVSLTGLGVKPLNHTCVLNWTTLSESNNKGFGIEHSANGINWSAIGFMASKALNGNSSQELLYSFVHHTPVAGTNHYRLRQTDLDGRTTYSNIVTARLTGRAGIAIYPNPTSSSVTVTGLTGGDRIQLYNQAGLLLLNKIATGTVASLSLVSYPPGTYQVAITRKDGSRQVHPIMLVK